jgi:hypothetical protein
LEGKLHSALGVAPLVSQNGRLSFFAMADFNERLKRGYTEDEWQREYNRLRYAPQVEWGNGFWPEEKAGHDRWRWCGKNGTLVINNPANHPKVVSLCFVAKTSLPGAATLNAKSALFNENLAVDAAGIAFAKTIEIPPGRCAIHFHCTALPYVHPSRTIVFGIFNFQLQEIDPAQHTIPVAQR